MVVMNVRHGGSSMNMDDGHECPSWWIIDEHG